MTMDCTGAAVHCLVGPNGSGKTNVLEAIAYLSLLESFRARSTRELLQWGEGHLRIHARTRATDGTETVLEAVVQTTPREERGLLRNGVRMVPSRFLGLLPVVLFLPEDLGLLRASPAERRRFLDRLLLQVSPEYARSCAQYQRALKQRNALLKSAVHGGGVSSETFDPWEAALASSGCAVTIARLELLETLQALIGEELRRLGETWADVALTYARRGSARDPRALEAELLALLQEDRARDIAEGSTRAGPHRDDWMLSADGRPVPAFASRGQERVCFLALLFLAVSYLMLRRGETPVVLLDDVFSELDDAHRACVLSALDDAQVFLTGTHLPPLSSRAQVWSIAAGGTLTDHGSAGTSARRRDAPAPHAAFHRCALE